MNKLKQLHARAGLLPLLAAAAFLLLVVVGLVEPWLPSAAFKEVASGPRMASPDAAYWLGTDRLGRSIGARIMEGIRLTLLVSFAAVVLAGVVGAAIGLLAAWYRGWVDQLIARLADVLFAFPAMIFGLIVAAVLGPGLGSTVIAIFFIVLPTMVRVTRGAALTVVGRDYIVTAHISGASVSRLLGIHVLPNVASATVVQMAYLMSMGMIIESGLSYLGLGVQPPASSLGLLLRENSAFVTHAPWTVLGPGAVLTLAIFCVNVMGDAARRFIEPLQPRPLQ